MLHRSNISSARGVAAAFALCLLALLTGSSVNATVLLSQSPIDHSPSRISDWSDDKQKADDFLFVDGPVTITRITWWGSYGTTPDPAIDNYVFKFFAEDPAVPGVPDNESFANGTRYPRSYTAADFSRTATAMVSDPSGPHDGGAVYAYSAVLERPITVQANTRYWVAITNKTPNWAYPSLPNSKWGWLCSSAGTQWFRIGHCPMCKQDWAPSETTDLAFELETFPKVAISGRAAKDPVISVASNKFLFTLGGEAEVIDEVAGVLTLDDGSGPVRVEAPGFAGVMSGDYVTATGLLNRSEAGTVLKADPADVIKIR